MNRNKYIYLCIWHNRHTDDKFVGYENLDDAIARCKQIVERHYNERYTFEQMGEDEHFSLFCSDDYYVAVEKIEVVSA